MFLSMIFFFCIYWDICFIQFTVSLLFLFLFMYVHVFRGNICVGRTMRKISFNIIKLYSWTEFFRLSHTSNSFLPIKIIDADILFMIFFFCRLRERNLIERTYIWHRPLICLIRKYSYWLNDCCLTSSEQYFCYIHIITWQFSIERFVKLFYLDQDTTYKLHLTIKR